MAEIGPFRGVRYNPARVKDPAAVICPPYDIITPQMEQELYHRSDYNFVRLESSRELPPDTATDNKYRRAAATLEQWLEEGILRVDRTPAVYLHDHHFIHAGQSYRRRGMTVRVRLEPWDRRVVRPHEGTLAAPKNDRLRLLWTLQADISPIFSLYDDPGQGVARALAAQAQAGPAVDFTMTGGERHQLWPVTAPEAVREICRCLADQPLYIADGHHRYESALLYQSQRRAGSPPASADQPFDFVMMTLVPFNDPGLVILPPHRLVRGIPRGRLEGLTARLEAFFDIEEIPLEAADIWPRVDGWLEADNAATSLLLFGLAPDRLLRLRLKDQAAASQMMPCFHTDLYKRLEVSLVDHVILEELLGLNDRGAEAIAYNHDRQEAIDQVRSGEYQLALLLKPIKPGVIKAIADAGDRMPRKSTYFHPKLPSGLVFYRLV
ncbi:MAG: DUF1015 domain-containing protein [Chloroflexota bacterium]